MSTDRPPARFLLLPGDDWALTAEPTATGLMLQLAFLQGAQPTEVRLHLDRAEGRAFAQAVLRAAGDGTERTFTAARREGGRDG